MIIEPRELPKGARSFYMCINCGYVFSLADENVRALESLGVLICPRCNSTMLVKLRPKNTRKIVLGV